MARGEKRRADGEGSVYQDGDGWRAELVISGRTVKRRAKTERDARKKLAQLRADRDAGLKVGTGSQKLKDFQTYCLDVVAPLEGLKPYTIMNYRQIYGHYIWPELGEIALDRLTSEDVERWGVKLVAAGLAQGTIDTILRRLNASLNLAVARKLIRENVAARVKVRAPVAAITDDDYIEPYLDPAQSRVLLTSITGHRLYALFIVAVTLGLRQGEIIGLRWSRVILDGPTPRIEVREQLQRLPGAEKGTRTLHRETPKGRRGKPSASRRDVRLTPLHVTILKAHRTRQAAEKLALGEAWAGEDLVFTSMAGTPLMGERLRMQFKRMLERAELPIVTFHSLRHTAGSLMLAAGAQIVNVSRVLGHSSVLITARIYAHSFAEGEYEAIVGGTDLVLKHAV
jgi:integrase